VLDPVAVGIGSLRTRLLKQFKEYKPSIIRGNASEIMALAGLWGLDGGTEGSNARGVDSTDSVSEAKTAAVALAKWTGGAVAVSGETDLVTDGSVIVYSYGGSHYMQKITGAGCALGGLWQFMQLLHHLLLPHLPYCCVQPGGITSRKKSWRTRSFYVHFLDELYKATAADIANNPFEMEEA